MSSDLKLDEDTQGSDVAATFGGRIRGKTILVTGVSPGGIGESTALAFASQQPALLALASRTKANLDKVAASIKQKYPQVNVKVFVVDFASQASVRTASEEIVQEVPKIDILVNNAAISPYSWQWTVEGLELQFGANHIGPFLFTNRLLPLVREAAKDAVPGDTRIVNVSSAGHNLSPIRFHDYNCEGKPVPEEEQSPMRHIGGFDLSKRERGGYPRFLAYGQSKTANILFSLYLQQHLKSAGIVSYALHPGTIDTHLGRDASPAKEGETPFPPPEWKRKTLDGGASTTLIAALDPALNDIKGVYLSDCVIKAPAAHAADPVVAEKLWHLSEEIVGEKFQLA